MIFWKSRVNSIYTRVNENLYQRITIFLYPSLENVGGVRKGADSYFPPEDWVRLVRLVSHEELPGETSGESTTEIS